MSAYAFERALDCTDYTPEQAIEIANGGTAFELADKIAAQSGHTALRAVDATEWLLNMCGPCTNCGERAATTRDHNDRPLCATCSGAFAALGQED